MGKMRRAVEQTLNASTDGKKFVMMSATKVLECALSASKHADDAGRELMERLKRLNKLVGGKE